MDLPLPQHYVKVALTIRGLDVVRPGKKEEKTTVTPYNITWVQVIQNIIQATFNPAMFQMQALRHRRETSGVSSELDKPVYILLNEYVRKRKHCVVYIIRSKLWTPQNMQPVVMVDRLPLPEKPSIKLRLSRDEDYRWKATTSTQAASGGFHILPKRSTPIGKDLARINELKRLQQNHTVKPSTGRRHPLGLLSKGASQSHPYKESTVMSPIPKEKEPPKTSRSMLEPIFLKPPSSERRNAMESWSNGGLQGHPRKQPRTIMSPFSMETSRAVMEPIFLKPPSSGGRNQLEPGSKGGPQVGKELPGTSRAFLEPNLPKLPLSQPKNHLGSLSKGGSQANLQRLRRSSRSPTFSTQKKPLPNLRSGLEPKLPEGTGTILVNEVLQLIQMAKVSSPVFVPPPPKKISGKINYFPVNSYAHIPIYMPKPTEEVLKELYALEIYNPYSSPSISLKKWFLKQRVSVK